MTNVCDSLLSVDIERNCSNIKGFENEAVLINRDDIDWASCEKNTTYDNVYKTIALKSSKTGYKCIQMNKGAFDGTMTEMNDGTYQRTFNETLSFRIFDSGVISAKVATELANANLIAIVKQKNKTADSSSILPIYRVYGISGQGLTATAITNEPNADDGNIWNVTLVSEGASQSAMYLFDTDEATTETKFAGYTA